MREVRVRVFFFRSPPGTYYCDAGWPEGTTLTTVATSFAKVFQGYFSRPWWLLSRPAGMDLSLASHLLDIPRLGIPCWSDLTLGKGTLLITQMGPNAPAGITYPPHPWLVPRLTFLGLESPWGWQEWRLDRNREWKDGSLACPRACK